MTTVYIITAALILVTMALALIRATLGPTVFDRVLAINLFGTKTILLICVAGFMIGRTDFLDLALLYSLMNFIGTVALLRYTRYGTFADDNNDMVSDANNVSAVGSPIEAGRTT